MLSGNKGEWSEVYVLLKLLADKKVFAGDKDLNHIKDLFYPIIKILRNERETNLNFEYDGDLILINANNESIKIPISEFQQNSKILLNSLLAQKTSSFEIPEIEKFINSYGSTSLKASSSIKSDITIQIHDFRTGLNPELGFSIKSQLGGASTLLNAAKTTNLIFKVSGIQDSNKALNEVNLINTKNKIRDRISKIAELGGNLEFYNFEKSTFKNNLTLIDSKLPEIVSQMVLSFYSRGTNQINELSAQLTDNNPLKFDLENNLPYYEYKIKRFLTDIALGMMPSTPWTGILDATGGYLVVKNDGDIICYHIYNRNQFEDYLFNHTKLETPSSRRHNFGVLYTEDDTLCFNLNLQIRFNK